MFTRKLWDEACDSNNECDGNAEGDEPPDVEDNPNTHIISPNPPADKGSDIEDWEKLDCQRLVNIEQPMNSCAP